jgi:hypothetical protein
MEAMKKLLVSLMVFALLTSTMVCGCWHEAEAASPAAHHSDNDHHHGHDGTDCFGADMQLPQQAAISTPDLKSGVHFDYIWTDEQPIWSSLVADNSIGGPPPDWPSLAQTYPPVLLLTQRLLI